MVNTASVWKSPSRSSRWWKCCLSAEKGERPSAMRRVITASVSRMGKPSRMSGRRGLSGVLPCVSMIERAAAEKPRIMLPVSPMKSEAGKVLNRRKPKSVPARLSAMIVTGTLPTW